MMSIPMGIETPSAIFAGLDKPDEAFTGSVFIGVDAELLAGDETVDDCESDDVIGIRTVPATGEYWRATPASKSELTWAAVRQTRTAQNTDL
jgi:hypothetical protein